MNQDVFFKNFELLADAPNGVQKLRELVLQLAVMGKLVPQDQNDEPASILLERIKTEKRMQRKEGKINSTKQATSAKTENQPFDTPVYWQWCRLGEVFDIVSGNAFKSGDFNEKEGVKTIKITNVGVGNFIETNDYLPSDYDKLYPQFLVNSGDILIALTRPYISEGLKVCYCPANYENSLLNQRVAAMKGIIKELSIDFVYYYLKSLYVLDYVKEKSKTMNQPNLSIKDLNNVYLPIPPLAEQKRIVTRIDELMALCDKLEARRQKKQKIQSKLNSAALERMLGAENQEEFEQYWQRICENFDLLYDNPENVEKLKQAILQLAVQGKLVPQDPEDEPASVLIEKIGAEKRRLIKEGKIKKTKALAEIDPQEVPYELPDNWEWIRIEDITDIGTGSTPLTAKHEYYENGSIPWITSSLTSLDYVDKAETYITETAVKECNLRMYPSGTLIVALYGQGKTRGQVSELRIEATINQACAAIVFIENFECIKKYVKLFFEQKYEELRALAAGGAQPNLNVGKIKETLIPLPPLNEQKRIVEKVEQFMRLCDELESKLRKSREDSEKLMEAVVKGLLEGAAA